MLIATLWPDPSWAQTKIARVGILNPNDEPDDEMRAWLSGMHFYQTLAEHGWVEGKNVMFEYRHAGVGPTPLAEPAAELMRMKVDALLLIGGPSVTAAFAATKDIPIVAHDLTVPSTMLYNESAHLAKVAAKHRLPGTSMFVEFADAGGLLAYGPNLPATVEQWAVLLAKVLDGAKPADLPIERPTKFEFVLNVKTARALHLTVPDTVLLRADRLIK
jgi:putative ABC transport system substrate-binding protein